MVTHIVLWKLHDRTELEAVRGQLESLTERVPGINTLAVGCPTDPSGPMVDISLYTEFATWEDLENYKVHPEHVKVAGFLKERVSERHVSDYES
jgi:hypothetical protein